MEEIIDVLYKVFLSEKVHLWIVKAHSPGNKFFSPEKKGFIIKFSTSYLGEIL